jgi:putative MATE family efflux protein
MRDRYHPRRPAERGFALTSAEIEGPAADKASASPPGVEHDLTEGSLLGHFRALGVPAAIGMVFNTLYNVVDTFYAGQISTDAQAGLTVAFTVFFMVIALGFGLGTGISALIGNALGAKERGLAARYAGQGLGFTAMFSLALGVFGWFASPALLRLMGAEGAYYQAAIDYLRVLLFATPFFLMAFAANGVLSAQGDTKGFQRALMASFFANLVLNPLLIYGALGIPGLGFPGIALSTVISQAGVATFMVRRAARSRVMQACGPADFRPAPGPVLEVMRQGFPASFNMLVMMFGSFAIQYLLQPFGPAAVAGYGVALRIEQIVLLPGFGITAALLPIVAQSFGARRADRVREAFSLGVKIGVGFMVCFAGLLWTFGPLGMKIFTDDPAVVAQGSTYLMFAGFILPVYFTMFAMTSLMQGLKRPIWPVAIGVYRQILGIMGFGLLFTRVLEIGVAGVWWAILCSVVSGFLLFCLLTAAILRRALAPIEEDRG